MSTILKTLKKLEEEKNILDQKLDLKGMLLKEDTVYPKTTQAERRKFFLVAVMITGLLITGGTGFYHWTSNHKTQNLSKHIPIKALEQQTLPPKKLSKSRTFEGVSMAAIPSKEAASAPKKSSSSKPLTKPSPIEASPSTVFSNLEEIESLIQSTTTLAKNSLITPFAIQNGHIPDVKVKGIIFFDKGSSFNHIIVTTQNNSNLKLRMGDPVQNAVLKSIHPNHVIFLYQDQLIKMGIGQ